MNGTGLTASVLAERVAGPCCAGLASEAGGGDVGWWPKAVATTGAGMSSTCWRIAAARLAVAGMPRAPWRDLPERYGPWRTCHKRDASVER